MALAIHLWLWAGPVLLGPSFTTNGVRTHNGLLAQIGVRALDSAGIQAIDGLADALLDDPATAHGFQYITECALPADRPLVVEKDGRSITLAGGLGLAPEWADGPCEVACQEWVSACLLARQNAYELPVSLYLDGLHPAFRAEDEPNRGGYTIREGAFFGNFFELPERQYACRAEGRDPLALSWRICTRPGARCGLQNVGACSTVDGENGAAVAQPVCEEDGNGFFTRCRAGTGPGARVYERVVTSFMRPTSFAGALAASCGEPPSSEVPPPRSMGGVGDACTTNLGCRDDLHCDVSYIGQGICTRACTPEGDPAVECGDATAVCFDNGEEHTCVRACTAGTCPAAQVCTGAWLQVSQEVTGCYPFCAGDADCGLGTFCNRRFGFCGAPPPGDELLEDGSPCTLEVDETGEIPQTCRGGCFVVDDDATRGICGSYLNLGTQDDCPDRPGTMQPLRPAGDDLALCVYRQCDSDSDCMAPLRCVQRPLQVGQCLY